jgi:squalene-hopene/tetraprenyl-beta-curcumene cyclase
MGELHEKLDGALLRARAFLISARDADGLWRDFRTLAGQSSDWVTAFVAYALKQSGTDETADSALSRLLLRQRRNGGWAYNEDVPADCDSTAWALLGLTARQTCEWNTNAIDRGVEFICRHQLESLDGGFSTYVPSDGINIFIQAGDSDSVAGWTDAHVCVTSVAVQALLTASNFVQSGRVAGALQYLLSKRLPEGNWSSYWWKGRAYSTYHAVRALSLAGFSSAAELPKIAKHLVARQRTDGAWSGEQADRGVPEAFETAFVLLALSVCNDSELSHAVKRGMRWLVSQQDGDGSWPSVPILRIPAPAVKDPDRPRKWRTNELGTGVIIRDEARLFTTAAVVWALAKSRSIV